MRCAFFTLVPDYYIGNCLLFEPASEEILPDPHLFLLSALGMDKDIPMNKLPLTFRAKTAKLLLQICQK